MEFISRVEFKPRRLLNRPEYRILLILEKVTREMGGGYRVMAQTSLGEIIAPQAASGSEETRDLAFRSINSKRLDFLVIDRTGMPSLAVEYQGHGHYQNRAFMRDAVKREAVRKAKIRFLEIPAEYDAAVLEGPNPLGVAATPGAGRTKVSRVPGRVETAPTRQICAAERSLRRDTRSAGGNGDGRGHPAHAEMDPRDPTMRAASPRAARRQPDPGGACASSQLACSRDARRRPIPFPFDDRIT